jgi:hypothetical protein
MQENLYIGIDDCFGDQYFKKTILVACPTNNHHEAKISEKKYDREHRHKRRYLSEKTIKEDFLYICEDETNQLTDLYNKLLKETFLRHSSFEKNLSILIDGRKWENKKIEELTDYLHINKKIIEFVIGGDKRVKLLRKADHLANMLYHIHSKNHNGMERILKFKNNFEDLEKFLEDKRVSLT